MNFKQLLVNFAILIMMIVITISIEAKAVPQDYCIRATNIDTSFYPFILRFEGISLKPYNDLGYRVKVAKKAGFVRPTRGYLHIGIGHKLTSKEIKTGIVKIGNESIDIAKHEITEKQAYILLDQDLVFFKSLISRYIKTDLNQNQYNAVTSFLYNRAYRALFEVKNGKVYFNKPTKFLKYLNKHDMEKAINNMGNIHHKLKGLQIRRKAERELMRS